MTHTDDMDADIIEALRDGPLPLEAIARAVGVRGPAQVRGRLDAAIDGGLVTARHLQTLPPRTLYGLTETEHLDVRRDDDIARS